MAYVPRLFRGEKWVTIDKKSVDPLRDMEIGHLTNTIKFIQQPKRLETLKQMYIAEFISLPAPNGEMAEVAYYDELDTIMNVLNEMSPREYFECHIKSSPLFQRLLTAYTKQTGLTDIPKPKLDIYDRLWYDTGEHPADSSRERRQFM